VPFEPSAGRQVLCRGCFDEKRGIAPTPDEV
jgi:CxxC-x17-CxxC domain-containing protein